MVRLAVGGGKDGEVRVKGEGEARVLSTKFG